MKIVAQRDLTPANEGERPDGSWHRRTEFFGSAVELQDGPQGFMVEHRPAPTVGDDVVTIVTPHFHRVRQFQLIVYGDRSSLGKNAAPSCSFHYADPSQPYGPIIAGKDGIGWLTLRPIPDVGIHFMPGSHDKMIRRQARNVVVPLTAEAPPEQGVDEQALIEPHEDGLAAYRLRVGPGEAVTGPDPAGSGGQYYAVMDGAIEHGGAEFPSLSLGWVATDEAAPTVVGGPEGADVIVLQFPVGDPAIEVPDWASVPAGVR